MSEHAKPQEWKRNIFREKDPAHGGGDVGESISNASNHNIFEKRCTLLKRRLELPPGEITVFDQLERKLKDCIDRDVLVFSTILIEMKRGTQYV